MTDSTCKMLVCSCDETMPLDARALRRGCPGADITIARQLCGAEMHRFKSAAQGGEVLVACTQEAPRFSETAESERLAARLLFANIRETAGWSNEAKDAGPKMAALLAAAMLPDVSIPGVTFESEGVTLILGRDDTAVEAGRALETRLDITVVVTGEADITPPATAAFPIRKGRVRTAKGYLGNFELSIDGFAAPAPSSRRKLTFGPARNGAISKADIVIDLTGGPALFPAHELRSGYLRADPADKAAFARVLLAASDLVGTFDKPRFVEFRADLCAHSRSRIVGCRRCIDLCPAGAITPAGNAVAIDPFVCGGCGECAAVCPTGAASYAAPSANLVLNRVRTALASFRAAGGRGAPVILFHDRDHGAALIDAAARFGAGLPARVLPLAVNETTQLGLESITAAFAYGAAGVVVLTRAKPRHDISGLRATLATADTLLTALGYGSGLAATLETDDPDRLAAIPQETSVGRAARTPSDFVAIGGKRDVLNLTLRELHRVAPAPVGSVALPKGAPFGSISVNTSGCTLCLACVGACPTGALTDNPDRPMLRFDESLCVQCSLCQGTCPERVITLEPRIDFDAFAKGPIVLNEEEPFCCTNCGKPFGVKSTIEKVKNKLAGSHWMFSGASSDRLALIEMCDDCRIEAATNAAIDPYRTVERPLVRTTDDYHRERADLERREAEMMRKIKDGDA